MKESRRGLAGRFNGGDRVGMTFWAKNILGTREKACNNRR
jgi:hypothetical protein